MKYHFDFTSEDLRKLIAAKISEVTHGEVDLDPAAIKLEVKSAQNYRQHEWEKGEMRVVVEVTK